ncbi:MAG TPA: diaminopimelate epimerase [Gammaproteobacteria bacterium]|nr:diaminopimelate epimerase [Gammaproteobacteria bacterium]
MRIHFTKMHGLGNDFIVIDAINQNIDLTTEQIHFMADRHFGIGCDQLLLVESSQQTGVDFHYRIFNADGSEVEQCGNGARCFARFVKDHHLIDKNDIMVSTTSGLLKLHIEADEQVTVNMGLARFEPEQIPFKASGSSDRYFLNLEDQHIEIGVVSLGNPHAVLQVDDVATAEVHKLGMAIESHPQFPDRVNVGFMEVVTRNYIRLRVFERGSGETLACGSGACAAVAIGQRQGVIDQDVTVELPGGTLKICWTGEENEPIWMTGPTNTVYEGDIEL